jgi:hypothetical protein
VLAWVRLAAWQLEQAERERVWGLTAARTGSVTQVHQLTRDTAVDALDTGLGELQAECWPAPKDPDAGDDEELARRADVAGRLVDKASWILRCA